MTLGQKQRLFTRLISELIIWAYDNGYEFTKGDAFRSPRAFGKMGVRKAYGNANSNHKLKLAQDLNLFINGAYMTTTEAHRPIGEKWESMHELCAWGGRFTSADGNHYSLEHNGRK